MVMIKCHLPYGLIVMLCARFMTNNSLFFVINLYVVYFTVVAYSSTCVVIVVCINYGVQCALRTE